MTSGGMTAYRDCTSVLETQYVGGDETPIEAVATALAEVKGVGVTELPPLYDVVDPDAITKLIEGNGDMTDAEGLLGFQFENWNVFVRSDGRIRICDATQSTEPKPVFNEV